MNNQTVKELREIAKERGLRSYHKLRKAELIDLLYTKPPRSNRKRNHIRKVTILPKPEDMDIFEKQEMMKNRSAVKGKLNEWYDWLISYVPKPIKQRVSDAYSKMKGTILSAYDKARSVISTNEKSELIQVVENDAEEEEHSLEMHLPYILGYLFL